MLIFTTCLLINFLASSSTILSLAFFSFLQWFLDKKDCQLPLHTIACHAFMHAYRFFLHLKHPSSTSLPHLISCLVHLVVLVILKNSFPSSWIPPTPPSPPQAEWVVPSFYSHNAFFYIYIALITSLYNSCPPHRLYSWGSYLEWVNEWGSLSQFDFPFMIHK